MKSPRLVLLIMCAGYFLVLLDVTIVNVALPSIGQGLGADVGGLQWVVDGYAIALASLMLFAGTLGDLRGHRRVVLAGLGLFALASLACGLAGDIVILAVARVAQGIGAALLLPGTLAVISRAFPDDDERARAIGVWAAVGSAALPAGPLLGGALVEVSSWRAVFFVNLPIVAAAFALTVAWVSESRGEPGRRLDPAGAVLGAGTLAALTFALIDAGHSGVGPGSAAGLAVALLLGAAFLVVEARSEDPMLPLGLFARPQFSAANLIAGAMNLVTLGLLFVLTLYLQGVKGLTPLVAGLAVAPLFLPLSLLAPFVGRLTARVGPRIPAGAGLLVAAVGVGLLARLGAASTYPDLLPATVLWGVGLGLLTPAVVTAAIGAVDRSRSGLASAVNNTARQAGGAVGIAALGALAGQPGGPGFLGGFHAAALAGAGAFAVAAVAALALLPGR